MKHVYPYVCCHSQRTIDTQLHYTHFMFHFVTLLPFRVTLVYT